MLHAWRILLFVAFCSYGYIALRLHRRIELQYYETSLLLNKWEYTLHTVHKQHGGYTGKWV